MTDEINALSRTQVINVEPSSGSVSVINAGPQGPPGAAWGPWIAWDNPRLGDFDVNDWDTGLVEAAFEGGLSKFGRYRVSGGQEVQYEAAIANLDPGAGDATITPPSGLTFGSDAVILELPFPRLDAVISDADIFENSAGFDGVMSAFGDYGHIYLWAEGHYPGPYPGALYSLSPLCTPVYDTASLADSAQGGGEQWSRLVMPISSTINEPWRWSGFDPVDSSLVNPSFWSWRGTYSADISAVLSGTTPPPV